MKLDKHKQAKNICVIGLGYVGLPLALCFAKSYNTIGYDNNPKRVGELNNFIDSNNDTNENDFKNARFFKATHTPEDVIGDIYVVTLPTPIKSDNRPDLSYLKAASKFIAEKLKKGDIVIYESTVYPGVTEDICLPILERISNLHVNIDFGLGYSPERVNPGEKTRHISQIKKVTSGSNREWANKIDQLYASIIDAGTFQATSIKVAEASKVIENTQRDLNIALINQLSQLFSLLDIDTYDVLEAAGTKWNFLPFKPGLVGGHCIGVDPYYLCHKAESVGYVPDIILAGRRLNESMPTFIASESIKLMLTNDISPHHAKVLILGATFKENCNDVRNSKVFNIVKELKAYSCEVSLYDPLVRAEHIDSRYVFINAIEENQYDIIILAVPHDEFIDNWHYYKKGLKKNAVVYDLKGSLNSQDVNHRL